MGLDCRPSTSKPTNPEPRREPPCTRGTSRTTERENMNATTKISSYRNTTTNETAPAHRIGETEDGRSLYSAQDGWEPIDSEGNAVAVECDSDGNWIVRAELLSVPEGDGSERSDFTRSDRRRAGRGSASS